MEIRVLGGFAVAIDGVDIPPEGWPSLRAAHHARQALRFQDAVVLQGGQVALCPSRNVALDAARGFREAGQPLDAARCEHFASGAA